MDGPILVLSATYLNQQLLCFQLADILSQD